MKNKRAVCSCSPFLPMVSIADLKARLSGLNINEVVGETLQENRITLIEKQKYQMLHGIDSEGHLMGKYKNQSYARKKFSMNPLAGFGNYDLRWKGEFQRQIDIKFFSTSMVFMSSDQKTEKLIGLTSLKIFGLNTFYILDLTGELLAEQFTKNILKRVYGL